MNKHISGEAGNSQRSRNNRMRRPSLTTTTAARPGARPAKLRALGRPRQPGQGLGLLSCGRSAAHGSQARGSAC